MNHRLLLLIALVLLGLLALYLARTRGDDTLAGPLSDFMVADTAAIDRIHITETSGRAVDLRRTRNGWTVEGGGRIYPAKQHQVDLLLKTFLRVEVKSTVPKSAEAFTLKMMAAASKRVEIYQGGRKPVKTWIVGHPTKDHFGTHMVLEKPGIGRSSVPFVMGMSGFTGILNTRFHANIDEWRSSVVFEHPHTIDIAALEVDFPRDPGKGYRIVQDAEGRVRLQDLNGRELPGDTLLARATLMPLQSMHFEYIDRELSARQRDSLFAEPPDHRVKVTLRDGRTESVSFWYKPYEGELSAPDAHLKTRDEVRMHALVQDTLLVTVQRPLFDRILQPREAFIR
jgi:hypothetical protein